MLHAKTLYHKQLSRCYGNIQLGVRDSYQVACTVQVSLRDSALFGNGSDFVIRHEQKCEVLSRDQARKSRYETKKFERVKLSQ